MSSCKNTVPVNMWLVLNLDNTPVHALQTGNNLCLFVCLFVCLLIYLSLRPSWAHIIGLMILTILIKFLLVLSVRSNFCFCCNIPKRFRNRFLTHVTELTRFVYVNRKNNNIWKPQVAIKKLLKAEIKHISYKSWPIKY
jgi:hypothetical protein